jgi:hypothetical protein
VKYSVFVDAKPLGELSFPSDSIGSKEKDIIAFFVQDKLGASSFRYLLHPVSLHSGRYGFMAWVVEKRVGRTVKGDLVPVK